jgi:peptidyl-prolyl cis-trans isomerase B (cyclophilin B)
MIPLALLMLGFGAPGCGTSSNDEVAVLDTNYGRIVFEFLPEYAPKHTKAFRDMISSGFFDGTRFHRVMRGKIVQGGDPNSKDDDPSDDGLGQPGQPTIPAEFNTQVKHVRGIVSAARKDDKDSATSQFFICLDDEPAYDGQYTVFGRVIDGMKFVDLIGNAPIRTDDPRLRDRPADPVTIKRAYLSTRTELGLPAKTAEPDMQINKNAPPAKT